MKKILLALTFLSFSFINYPIINANNLDTYLDNLRGNNCDNYIQEFEKCVNSSSPLGINEFVCLDKNFNDYDKILSQIILDIRLKEIDQEIYNYLNELEQNKFKYFGPTSNEDETDAAREIENKFNEFRKKYKRECEPNGLINNDLLKCTGGVNVFNVGSSFSDNCNDINEVKLYVNKKAAYTILHINSNQVQRDQRAIFEEEQRSLYGTLIEKFYLQLSFVQRMWTKWTIRTPNTY